MAEARRLTGNRLDEVLAAVGLDDATYHRWKRQDERGVTPGRPQGGRSRALPPTPEEVAIVERFARQYPLKGYRRLAWFMVERGVCSLRPYQVYEILLQLDLIARRGSRVETALKRPAPPERPDEVWHIDLMYVPYRDAWLYLIDIVDGYSRYLVHWRLSPTMLERDVTLVAQEAVDSLKERRPGEPKMVHDRGCQFMSRDWRRFIEGAGAGDIPTRVRHPQSNGKVERMHRTHREEGLVGTEGKGYAELVESLEEWTAYYNWERPHHSLNYLTPGVYYRGDPAAALATREQRLKEGERRRSEYWRNQPLVDDMGAG